MSGSSSAYEVTILERVQVMKGENGKTILEMIVQ